MEYFFFDIVKSIEIYGQAYSNTRVPRPQLNPPWCGEGLIQPSSLAHRQQEELFRVTQLPSSRKNRIPFTQIPRT